MNYREYTPLMQRIKSEVEQRIMKMLDLLGSEVNSTFVIASLSCHVWAC